MSPLQMIWPFSSHPRGFVHSPPKMVSTETMATGYGSKLSHPGTAGFSPTVPFARATHFGVTPIFDNHSLQIPKETARNPNVCVLFLFLYVLLICFNMYFMFFPRNPNVNHWTRAPNGIPPDSKSQLELNSSARQKPSVSTSASPAPGVPLRSFPREAEPKRKPQ